MVTRKRYPNLAAYLAATGETQVDFGLRVGVSNNVISRLVRRVGTTRWDRAKRISDAANIPVESLLSCPQGKPAAR